jgi:hypothetical protein
LIYATKTYLFLKTSHLLALTKISYVSQEIEHQVAEITLEMCGAICHWMERSLLRLGVPPTYVTYRVKYVPAVTGKMVLCMVTVLPHPNLSGFKGKVCYNTALTITTALDVTCRQALGCLLDQ